MEFIAAHPTYLAVLWLIGAFLFGAANGCVWFMKWQERRSRDLQARWDAYTDATAAYIAELEQSRERWRDLVLQAEIDKKDPPKAAV